MKNNITVKFISIISAVLMLVGIFTVSTNFQITAQSNTRSIDTIISQVLSWKYNGTVQELLNHEIAADMGNSVADWYVISLSRYQNGLDFSSCIQALDEYTASAENLKATDKQRIAMVYTAMGISNDFVAAVLKETVGDLGIMSYIYGLILTDCGAYTDIVYSRETILDTLLSFQNTDGGWALTGTTSDVDVTAMAVQSMARYYGYENVKVSIDKALTFLSRRQQPDGDFQSYGTSNAESTAQVMIALNALDIDYKTDKRFIKNGQTVYDGIVKYQCADGGFSHIVGTKSNALATVQVFCALISAERYEKNLSHFFSFVDNNISLSWKKVSEVSKIETSKSEVSQSESSAIHESVQESIIPSEPSKNQNTTSSSHTVSSTLEENISSNVEQSISQSGSESSHIESIVPENAEPVEENSIPDRSEVSQAESSILNSSHNLFETEKKLKDEVNPTLIYRLIICIGVVCVFGAIFTVMLVRKKANRKNLLVLIIAFVGTLILVWTINIQSKEEYYTAQDSTAQTQTVTLSILCTNAVGQTENHYLPKDGIILSPTIYGIEDGDTVFDVLLMAVKENQIPLDYTGDDNTFVYIKGINYLYEFDCGDLSGWMYKVNGQTPNTGCSDYILNDGDIIEWVYTCNMGKDIAE